MRIILYSENLKEILENAGVDISKLNDNLYSTLLKELAEIGTVGSGSVTMDMIKQYVTDVVANIVADAPDDFDTLKEISDWISTHEDSAAAMNSAIQNNTNDISELQTGKVDIVDGKFLSTNDFTDADKSKLDNLHNYDDTEIKADIEVIKSQPKITYKTIKINSEDIIFKKSTSGVYYSNTINFEYGTPIAISMYTFDKMSQMVIPFLSSTAVGFRFLSNIENPLVTGGYITVRVVYIENTNALFNNAAVMSIVEDYEAEITT